MKKSILLFVAALAAMVMTGCGDSDIDKVKKTVLGYDSARTVETVLNARCSSLKWKSFKSTDGYQVVEVTGVWKDNKGREALDKYEKTQRLFLDNNMRNVYDMRMEIFNTQILLPGDKIKVQFVISADGKEITLTYGAYLTKDDQIKCRKKFPDDKGDTGHLIEMDNFLATMYSGCANTFR